MNCNGKNVYCDWIADSDYLKRQLVCEATISVIEKRIEQSKEVIFAASKSAYDSKWVSYELNYAHEHGKKIRRIDVNDIGTDIILEEMTETWYLDRDYNNMELFEP